MQVLRGAVEATVPEQHLDGANVSAQIKQMGREGMTKAMWRDALGDPRLQDRLAQDLVKAARVNLVPRRPDRNPGKSSGPEGRSARR